MIKPEISKIISIFRFVYFLLLGLIATVQLGFCQSYHVHNYCEDDGLLNSTVHDLLQDSTGRMWFTTRSGISCYDGTEWTSYTAANGLPGVDYTFLEIDDENIIWALSKHRSFNIAYFHNEQWHSLETPPLQNYPNFIIDFKVSSIHGRIIIAIASRHSGLLILEDDQWKIIEKPQKVRTTFLIHGIAFFDDTIYAATSDGLFYVTNDSLARYTGCDLPAGGIRGLRRFKTDTRNRLWLAGTSWIGIIENHSFRSVAEDLYIPFGDEFEYLLLQPDYRRGIFYGNPVCCYYLKFSKSEPERLGLESGLISDGITSLFMDREKNLWCSTLRGVSKIAGMRFQNYRKENGLLNDEVTAIVEIKPGSYIFGHNNGLTFFDDGTFRYHKFPRSTQISPIATRVIDLAMDRERNVWMAVSSKGLGRINPAGEITWIDDNPHIHNPVKSVMVDSNNRVWIADANGLITYNGKSWQRVSTSKEDLRRVRKVIRGSGNEIYLATYFSGLYVYKNKKWIGYRSPKVESANNIYAAHRDSDGRLLVGSLAGLFTVDHDTLKRFDLAGYRLKRSVYLILEDRKKRLWFGTDNGVIRWDGNEIR
ncbi:hypothetical protein GF337_18190, partial [candidate division KSB1 bacterium]|nr:hypothetical protein [candidate division KSB1 bacterium]